MPANINKDPLKDLFSSEKSVAVTEEIRDILMPFCRINPNTKIIDFLPTFRKLSNEKKILIYLIGMKAKKSLFQKSDEKITPKELIIQQIMPVGSVKSALRNLHASHGHYLLNYKLFWSNFFV